MASSDRTLLADWLAEALHQIGGKATLLEAAKAVWKNHGSEISEEDDLFYTWQYDLRWAAKILRDDGRMKSKEDSAPHTWELRKGA